MENEGIPSKLDTDHDPQLLSKLFEAVRSTVRVSNISTTEYRPQTNDQAEYFNPTLISRLCHHVSKHKTDLDTYLLPFTFAYNVLVYRPIKMSHLSGALTQALPALAIVVPKRTNLATGDENARPIYARLYLIKHATELQREANEIVQLAQRRYKKN